MNRYLKLGEICTKITDGTHHTPKYTENGIPFLRVTDITKSNDSKKFISKAEHLDLIKRCHPTKGDILYTKNGTIGVAAKITWDYDFSIFVSLCLLKPNTEIVNTNYLVHFLNTKFALKQALSHTKTGTISNLHLIEIKKIKIPIPPLSVQQKIAKILDAANVLKQNDKALLKKYDELANAFFLDLFGDPVRNSKGWKVNKLKQISTKIHSGNTPKGGSSVYVDEGVTFFRSQNVWKNRLVYKDIAFLDQATHEKMKKSSLKHRDLLMTKTGRINTENSSLGRASMYLGEDDKANLNGHVYLIRLKKGVVNEFILHILTSKEYRGHIRNVCVGGIDKRQLNKGHIEDFPIINPPLELQNKFVERLTFIQHQKSITKKSLEKSEALFNSLLQKAFNGELE